MENFPKGGLHQTKKSGGMTVAFLSIMIVSLI